ncbi:MAG: hypothetical protein ACRD0U_06295 [Acidimicrobiales bacterium]
MSDYDDDPSLLGGLWDAAEGAANYVGNVAEGAVDAMETVGDGLIAAGTHVAATAAFAVGEQETANEWEDSAEGWYDEMIQDGGDALHNYGDAIDSLVGTDLVDGNAETETSGFGDGISSEE